MMKAYIIAIVTLIFSVSLSAQDQVQAFRYSQVYPVGTARYAAMGGALGAVGGDITAASTNPAGLGIYRSSEFSITPSVYINNSKANFLGGETKDSEYNLNIGSLGIVTAFDRKREEGLVGSVFSFAYNSLNNFHSSTTMQGENFQSSLLDNFTWHANSEFFDGIVYDDANFYEDLAFETSLMPLDTMSGYWHDLQKNTAVGYDGYGEEQVRIVDRRGYLGEYSFSYALNFSNKVYAGATFGIHSLRFYEDIYHTEEDINDLTPDFVSFRFGEYNTTRGTGYAFKVGVIVKPINILRIGAAFHAPTIYRLEDVKFTEMYSYFNSSSGIGDGYDSEGEHAKKYTLRTPYRASLSAALIIGKLGIVSAEYEYLDYSTSDLDSPGNPFAKENIAISQDFKNVHNFKAGAELRLNPLYFRAGTQYYMNPYIDPRNGSDIWIYSAGLGFRTARSYIDFSYSLRNWSELYSLYKYAPESEEGFERSVNKYSAANIMVTMGYKF